MQPPFVSIVIPNLHSPVIDQTLESIRRQTYDHTRFEVIVVGQDRFGLVQGHNHVQFLRSDVPLAPSVARNRGAAAARGSVIAFLDADCVAQPSWLETLVSRYVDTDVHVVGGAVAFELDRYWTFADNLSTFHDYLTDSPGEHRPQLPSLNLSLHHRLFDEIGGFDERYPRPAGEDSDLSLRLRQAGYTLYFEHRAVVFHHPPRTGLSDLLRHAFYLGKYSIKVDPRYAGTPDSFPTILRWRPSLILAAPVLAAGAAARIYLPHPKRWRFWYTAPAVFAAKMAWCAGAASRPSQRQ
jgi:glycosyltransferase involved in cell wall biosynthesis